MAQFGTFLFPQIHDNSDGWGPCEVPEQFKDTPYQPFSKDDRLGKVRVRRGRKRAVLCVFDCYSRLCTRVYLTCGASIRLQTGLVVCTQTEDQLVSDFNASSIDNSTLISVHYTHFFTVNRAFPYRYMVSLHSLPLLSLFHLLFHRQVWQCVWSRRADLPLLS